ncbi:hypothetical protein B296_00053661 [Ensete ventricosum]|uniref:Uncharacterized protein n=1 Tax=Ensete ventricosum TaxID=4639 RepID=A0A426X5D6_ENSVE|nr:hypothetical protein B296_00053661 [Ensete ventricosum]
MVVCSPCHYPVVARRPPHLALLFKPTPLNIFHRPPFSKRPAAPQPINAIGDHSSSFSGTPQQQQQQQQQKEKQVRTLFPGGFKRPELNIPTLVLRLSVDEVLEREAEVDVALLKRVGVVVLDGGDQSGARLYEAACALKSLLRDRAYLLIAERVDIAAAVGASGVVLSDAGSPYHDIPIDIGGTYRFDRRPISTLVTLHIPCVGMLGMVWFNSVLRFDLYRLVWVVHNDSTGYRYAGRLLPCGIVEISVYPRENEVTPRLLA